MKLDHKWIGMGSLGLGCLLVLGAGCVRRPTLREVKQDPVYQRAAQAHQGFAQLTAPAACQGRRCRTVLRQEKTYFAQAHKNYHILIARDPKNLAGVLARCQLGDIYAERMTLLKRFPEPSRALLRREIVAKIKASFTRRGIAPGGQEQMLRRPKIQEGINKNVEQWSQKRKSDIDSVARRSQLRARHHYKQCFEDAERHRELKAFRERAQRFLKQQGT